MEAEKYSINNSESKTISVIGINKQLKLKKKFPKYLKSNKRKMIKYFGKEKADTIMLNAELAYPEIVVKTPSFNTPMYDALMILAGKMGALKKGMRAAGISTEEFVKFFIDSTRSSARIIPSFMRRMGGRIYLSRLVRVYLKRVAKSVTANGWPTRLIDGTKNDDFDMSIETENCQMVAFWESIGEGDIKPYCTFFDFTSAESLGVGLKQVSSVDSGICKYCFYKKGKVEWPDSMRKILTA